MISLETVLVGLLLLVWLYVAARVVTRAVLRTIREKESE